MSAPSLGKFDGGATAAIDLPRLLETRMLIQANSGGGKSRTLRRLLEQTAGQVQQFVVDPEGEFATLREKHDFVIAAAHDGDALAHPRTAQILARRLLETGVSAILDIYDLKAHERAAFVRLFFEALVNAPKALWQPCLVVLDEAHVFCPEAGKAESAGAVIDLATRGRKRGFALVAATQRLAKLNKDCAAELLNKLIGRTGLDVDVQRAADELGMTKREAMEKLRGLDPGEFFAFGPALSPSVQRLKVGDVKTTHPKSGDRVLRAPPTPTAAIVAVLPKLADLPKEAEQEARSLADLRKELASVRRELTLAQKGSKPTPAAAKDPNQAAELRAARAMVKRLQGAIEELMKFIVQINAQDFAAKAGDSVDPAEIQKAIEAAVHRATKLIEAGLEHRNRELQTLKQQGERLVSRIRALLKDTDIEIAVDVKHQESFAVAPAGPSRFPKPTANWTDGKTAVAGNGDGSVSGVQQRILNAIAELEQIGATEPDRKLAAFMAGYTHLQSKGFVNAMSSLRTAGLIDYRDSRVVLTDAGREQAQPPDRPRSAEEVQARIVQMLGGASGRILQPLIDSYPEPLSRESLAQAAGYGHLQSKGFVNSMSRLSSLGFIEYGPERTVKAKPVLFLEGG